MCHLVVQWNNISESESEIKFLNKISVTPELTDLIMGQQRFPFVFRIFYSLMCLYRRFHLNFMWKERSVNWRTSFWVRLAWPKRPKIVCSPSYADIRSRVNTTRGLDFEHMIKARAHKGGVRIGRTPKKLASICCP
jgi:hypothetical protein